MEPRPFGPYRLEELINRGGFSEVWLARDSNRRSLAIRRLVNTSMFHFTERSRFGRGCEILRQLQGNDLIIGYLHHGRIEGCPYLAMEYVEASNLKLILARCDDLLQEYLGNILIDSARALEHVHDSGYMHLDFKPENLLVTRNANIKLIDFDLAQPRPDQPRKASRNPGTPAYMAPEQLQRLPYDHRVDIFAFGVMAYELLTLEKPFPGESPDEILRRQLHRSDFRVPRDINPNIPPALERIVLKCLERDPGQRYPFLSIVVRDLERALYV
ncbi:MAG: serine/threonine protein kinase [Verrucomicrobiae bacterium]|nr:serine/threonine protein kinase [Verrucomicrobiae bacterium]